MPAPPVIVITGANAGIGYAASEALAARGATVVMACRSLERGEAARAQIQAATGHTQIHCLPLDVSSVAAVDRCADELLARWPVIHALINNAGLFDLSLRSPRFTEEGVEQIWATNCLGPYWLSARLRPALAAAAPGRIIDVSSKGLLAHPRLRLTLDALDGPGGRYSPAWAYYHSKLALLTHTLEAARRLDPAEIVTHAVWVPAVQVALDRLPPLPAWLRGLYLLKRRLALTPAAMAPVYAALALDPVWGARTGCVVDHRLGTVRPPKAATSPESAAALEAALSEMAAACRQRGI